MNTKVRGTCTIEGCTRPHKAHGWCPLHYKRVRRNGSVEREKIPQPPTCLVETCNQPCHANSLCSMHYSRQQRNGTTDPLPGPTGRWHNYTGIPTYTAVHLRLRKIGRAADFTCPCGQPAEDWAYDHADGDPLTETRRDGWTVTYSADLDRYTPMCKPCHWRLDHKMSA